MLVLLFFLESLRPLIVTRVCHCLSNCLKSQTQSYKTLKKVVNDLAGYFETLIWFYCSQMLVAEISERCVLFTITRHQDLRCSYHNYYISYFLLNAICYNDTGSDKFLFYTLFTANSLITHPWLRIACYYLYLLYHVMSGDPWSTGQSDATVRRPIQC